MIIPNKHTNSEGDIVFEISHLSENKKEQTKGIIDGKTYKNWITVNPLTNEVIKFECECYDFTVNRFSDSPCKHLRESITLLNTYFTHKPNI